MMPQRAGGQELGLLGKALDVVVTYSDLDVLWLQRQDRIAELDRINKEMQECEAIHLSPRELSREKIFRCLYSGDRTWYRARILDWSVSARKAEVFFIDYGNKDIVSLEDFVTVAHESWRRLPSQALPARLSGLKPSSYPAYVKHLRTALVREGRKMEARFEALLEEEANGMRLLSVQLLDPLSGVSFNTTCHQLGFSGLQFAPLAVHAGTFEEVVVSHVNTPQCFYVQLVSHTDCIEDVQACVEDFCVSACPSFLLASLCPGQAVCAKFSVDGSWYRAQCCEVADSGAQALAEFVDFGNKEKVPKTDMRPITPALAAEPRQSVLCSLASLFGSGPVSEQVVSIFTKHVLGKMLRCHFLQQTASGIWEVKLCTEDGTDFGEEVVKLIVDDATKKKKLTSPPTPVTPSSSRVRRSSSSSEDLAKALATYHFPQLKMNVKDGEQVIVMHVTPQGIFSCQLQSNLDELYNVNARLTAEIEKSGKALDKVAVGVPCAVLFTDDQQWYRGEIVCVGYKGNWVVVRFVDYGNLQKSAVKWVKHLPLWCLQFPKQGFGALLTGIEPVGGTGKEWPQMALDALMAHVEGVVFLATVGAVAPGKLMLELVWTDEDRGRRISLSEWLVKKGYARFVGSDGIVHLANSKQRPEEDGDRLPAANNTRRRLSVAAADGQLSSSLFESSTESLQSLPNTTAEPGSFMNEVVEADSYSAGSNGSDAGLPCDSPVDVIVSHAESPQRFWCQMSKDSTRLEELQQQIDDYIEQARSACHPVVGLMCLALFDEDNTYYRASILEIVDKKHVRVQFVDFGNTEVVRTGELKTLISKINCIKSLSHICCLSGFELVECSEALSKEFCALVVEKECVVHTSGQQVGDAIIVELSNGFLGDVSKRLKSVLAGCAGEEQKATNIVADKTGRDKQRFAQERQRSIPCAVVGIGRKLRVVVSVLNDVDDLWCQLVTSELSLLQEKLQAHCASQPPLLQAPAVGTVCSALFADDSMWYRAQVTSVTGNEISVLFVDYGNEEMTPINKLCSLPQELMVMPALAFHCQLANCSSNSELISDHLSLLSRLEEIVDGVELLCTVVGQSEEQVWSINLSLPETQEDILTLELHKTSGKLDLEHSVPPCPVDVGYRGSVVFSTIVSPCHFWCQRLDQELETLQEELQKHCHEWCEGSPAGLLPLPRVGALYGVLYNEDKCWYRALATDITNDGQFCILFIDYGNMAVTSGPFCPLSKNLAEQPAFAFQCRFNERFEQYDQAAVVGAIERVSANIELLCYVIAKDKDLWVVDLCLNDQTNFLDAVKEKISLCAASDQPHLPEITRSAGVQPGTTTECVVSCIARVSEVWLQQKSDNVAAFQELVQHHCEQLLSLSSRPNVGAACIVQSHEGGKKQQWCRAEVICVDDLDMVTVRLVDFGIKITMEHERLFALPAALTSQAALAFCCQLSCSQELQEKDISALTVGKLVGEIVLCYCIEKMNDGWLVHLEWSSQTVASWLLAQCLWKVTCAESGRFPVIVTVVASAKEIWCQHCHQDLDVLQEKLMTSAGMKIDSASVGLRCSAIYSEDSLRYRADVLVVHSDRKVTVRFVDYGNEEIVDMDDIYVLPDNLVEHWAMAFKCSLVECPAEVHKEELTDVLCKDPEGVWLCQVVSCSDSCWHVELFDENGVNVLSCVKEQLHSAEPCQNDDGDDDNDNDEGKVFIEEPGTNTKLGAEEIPAACVSSGSQEQVILVNCQSIDDLWCQLCTTELDLLQENLQEHCSKQQFLTDLCSATVLEGMFCAVFDANTELCYRAQVEELLPDSTVRVLLVDFGSHLIVSVHQLCKLSPELAKPPAMAFHCSLAGISDDVVREDAAVVLKEFAGEGERVTCHIVTSQETAGQRQWRVRLMSESGGRDINTIIRSKVDSGKEHQMTVNSYQDEELHIYRDSAMLYSHHPIDRLKIIEPRIECGSSMDVRITCVRSLLCFACQLSVTEDDLTKLEKRMRRHYNALPLQMVRVCDVEIQPGLVCAVSLPRTGSWYRGCVQAVCALGGCALAEVFLIDWGVTVSVEFERICSLHNEFSHLPAQAVNCCLDGINPEVAKKSHTELYQLFYSFVSEARIHCSFKACTPLSANQWLVSLCVHGMSVLEMLHEKCHKLTISCVNNEVSSHPVANGGTENVATRQSSGHEDLMSALTLASSGKSSPVKAEDVDGVTASVDVVVDVSQQFTREQASNDCSERDADSSENLEKCSPSNVTDASEQENELEKSALEACKSDSPSPHHVSMCCPNEMLFGQDGHASADHNCARMCSVDNCWAANGSAVDNEADGDLLAKENSGIGNLINGDQVAGDIGAEENSGIGNLINGDQVAGDIGDADSQVVVDPAPYSDRSASASPDPPLAEVVVEGQHLKNVHCPENVHSKMITVYDEEALAIGPSCQQDVTTHQSDSFLSLLADSTISAEGLAFDDTACHEPMTESEVLTNGKISSRCTEAGAEKMLDDVGVECVEKKHLSTFGSLPRNGAVTSKQPLEHIEEIIQVGDIKGSESVGLAVMNPLTAGGSAASGGEFSEHFEAPSEKTDIVQVVDIKELECSQGQSIISGGSMEETVQAKDSESFELDLLPSNQSASLIDDLAGISPITSSLETLSLSLDQSLAANEQGCDVPADSRSEHLVSVEGLSSDTCPESSLNTSMDLSECNLPGFGIGASCTDETVRGCVSCA